MLPSPLHPRESSELQRSDRPNRIPTTQTTFGMCSGSCVLSEVYGISFHAPRRFHSLSSSSEYFASEEMISDGNNGFLLRLFSVLMSRCLLV
mmetsp:Transcript_11401/g.23086  ORF Transcript_11401/g.23086 Transcript_11401/m.23086 type:complete len:92 (-) Transcript_11401:2880-3155(-)